jgi:hypothetical protein
MELLAQVETNEGPGRWIVTPRKGVRFMGVGQRQRLRTRDRRRRVFVFFLESIGLSFLIGIVPPLRPVWAATAVMLVLLLVYVCILLSMKRRSALHAGRRVAVATGAALRTPRTGDSRASAAAHRLREGGGALFRSHANGFRLTGEFEDEHVVVRRASEAGARA